MEGDETRCDFIDATDTRACAETAEPAKRPYRPMPNDFEALWPSVGWSEAELVWQAHARNISRWLDECGRDRMVLARKNYLDAQRTIAGRVRRKRYVLGRTLSPDVGCKGGNVDESDPCP